MEKKGIGRSGQFIDESGQSEFWWDGINYHSIIPEELIDAVLDASDKKEHIQKEGEKYGSNNLHGRGTC